MNLPPELIQLLNRKLKLRSGCRLVLQEFQGENSYVLEEPNSGQFFRLGVREARFLRSLDAAQPIAELLKNLKPESEMQPEQALRFLLTLWTSGLLEDETGATDPAAKTPRRSLLFQNPLYIKIPAGNPDRIVTWLTAKLGWIFTRPILVLWVVAILAAGILLAANWDQFKATTEGVLASSNWFWLFLTFFTLKLIHELGHAMVCKHLGGRTPDAGFFFFFFAPLTYVDATSSWSMPSKWSRIQVSSAGMLAELFFGALAVFVWVSTNEGIVNTVAHNAIITATVVTFFFNLNPLMRFDGYYILADLVEIPNLYVRATKKAWGWIRWLFLGDPVQSQDPAWIGLYGIGTIIWRFMLTLSISVGAIVLLHGIGIVLVAVLLLNKLFSLKKSFVFLMKNRAAQQRAKFGWVRAALVALVLAALSFIPVRPSFTTDGAIEYAGMTPVRVECPGTIEEVEVRSGDMVKAGDLLLRLSNPEQVAQLAILKTNATRAEVMANQFRQMQDPQRQAKAEEQIQALRAQIAEQERYYATLELRAPVAGKVVARDLSDLKGSFVRTGKEVLAIGSATQREARIAVHQEHGDEVRDEIGQEVRVLIPSRNEVATGKVIRFEPRASRTLRYEGITALAGGPIPVRRATEQNIGELDPEHPFELLEPHFQLIAELSGQDVADLRSGESCIVRFYSGDALPIWKLAWNKLNKLVEKYAQRRDG